MRARLIETGKWVAILWLAVGAAYVARWNEYESPWGLAVQAAKTEALRAKLCN